MRFTAAFTSSSEPVWTAGSRRHLPEAHLSSPAFYSDSAGRVPFLPSVHTGGAWMPAQCAPRSPCWVGAVHGVCAPHPFGGVM